MLSVKWQKMWQKTMRHKGKIIFIYLSVFLLAIYIANFLYIDETGSSGYTLFFKSYNNEIKDGDYYIFDAKKIFKYKNIKVPKRLIKPIYFNRNNLVVINEKGIYINQSRMNNSERKKELNKQSINYVGKDCAIAYLNHKNSYDSRYFGCVDLSKAIKIIPLF